MSSDTELPPFESKADRRAREAAMSAEDRAKARGNRYAHGLTRRALRAGLARTRRATRVPTTPVDISRVAKAAAKRERKNQRRLGEAPDVG